MNWTIKTVKNKIWQVSTMILISRWLALAQDFFLCRYFVTSSSVSDAFFTSFKLPNLIRRLIGEGSTGSTLVPIVSGLVKQNKQATAGRLLLAYIIFFGSIFSLLAVIIWQKPLLLMNYFAPGLSLETNSHVFEFFPKMFLFIIFISACEVLNVGLRATGNFKAPAFGPILFHLFFIASTFIAWTNDFHATFLAWTIGFIGLIKLAFRLFSFIKTTNIPLLLPDKEVLLMFKDTFLSMLPLLLGTGIVQTHIFAETIVGSYLKNGEISALHYVLKIFSTPQMILISSISVVTLSALSFCFGSKPIRYHYFAFKIGWVSFLISSFFAILMFLFAPEIFHFFCTNKEKFLPQMIQAFRLLVPIMPISILNSILFSILYTSRYRLIPATVSGIGVIINISLSAAMINSRGFEALILGFVANQIFIFLTLPIFIWYLELIKIFPRSKKIWL